MAGLSVYWVFFNVAILGMSDCMRMNSIRVSLQNSTSGKPFPFNIQYHITDGFFRLCHNLNLILLVCCCAKKYLICSEYEMFYGQTEFICAVPILIIYVGDFGKHKQTALE